MPAISANNGASDIMNPFIVTMIPLITLMFIMAGAMAFGVWRQGNLIVKMNNKDRARLADFPSRGQMPPFLSTMTAFMIILMPYFRDVLAQYLWLGIAMTIFLVVSTVAEFRTTIAFNKELGMSGLPTSYIKHRTWMGTFLLSVFTFATCLALAGFWMMTKAANKTAERLHTEHSTN